MMLGLLFSFLGWLSAPQATNALDGWALRPLTNPQVPDRQGDWARTEIDDFILQSLHERDLSPSREASRGVLIRRLFFDLHGLPPTPQEVADFINDPDPEAYESLVDRLLASPRYGERWARHWLDVIHYGETHGFDKDKLRPHAWPYRDYVIRSFQADKPYRRFIEEQIAGDVLYPDVPDGLVALGFLAAGPWDFVGHVELREGTLDKKITRSLDRDDILMTTMSTFTSQTVHCARCHDHKFDPIPQRDYYRLQAVFAGLDRVNIPYDADPSIHRKRRRLVEEQEQQQAIVSGIEAEIPVSVSSSLAKMDEQIVQIRRQFLAKKSEDAKSSTNGFHSQIANHPQTTKWVQVDLGRVYKIRSVHLFPARPVDFPDTEGFGFPRRFRVEASLTPDLQDPLRLGDWSETIFPNPGDNVVSLSVEEEGGESSRARYVRVTATELWERTDDFVFALGELQIDGEADSGGKDDSGREDQEPVVSASDTIDAGRWHREALVDGFDSRRWVGSEARWQRLGPERLETLHADREARLADAISLDAMDRWSRASTRIDEIESELSTLPPPSQVYAIQSLDEPRPVSLLHRGDVAQPLEIMTPGTLSSVKALDPHFEDAVEESQRRAALARWVSADENPLTWRSIVNRVWHYHFGKGIVATPNDFGRMGAAPTHPELLDWLAFRFLEEGGSFKGLHRLMVTSSVYRQSSRSRPDGVAKDADNQYLWRMSRRRLEAESIRDAILSVSGNLDFKMGGEPERHFQFENDHSPRYDYVSWNPAVHPTLRRSIYRHIVRSVPDPFMECLDCADPSMLTPKRHVTLTAAQALALLNDPFILNQTQVFAQRLRDESGDQGGAIEFAFQLCLGRSPKPEERALFEELIQNDGYEGAARLLFNLNEFVFVD